MVAVPCCSCFLFLACVPLDVFVLSAMMVRRMCVLNVLFNSVWLGCVPFSLFRFVSVPVRFRFGAGSVPVPIRVLVRFQFGSSSVPVRLQFNSGSTRTV